MDGQKYNTCDVAFQSANAKDSTSHLNCGSCEDLGVLGPRYDEDGMLGEFPLDVELTSRGLCIQDIEGEVLSGGAHL